MIKTIIKELIIFLLLLVTVALLIGVLLYDYMPTNKEVPEKQEAYILDRDVQDELKTPLSFTQDNIIKTYSINGADLRNYEHTEQYDKGKINPFEQYTPPPASTPEEEGGTPTGNNTTNNNNNGGVGNFYENGHK